MIPGKLGTIKSANTYSQIGKEVPGTVPTSHISLNPKTSVGGVASCSSEFLRLIETDWKNLAMDLAQLGLTIVGLLDVAPPVQAGADILNGSIDIKRGHPWIGALSIASATSLGGLIPGIGLACIRLLKVVWSGFKALGRTVYVLATSAAKPICSFVVTRGNKILSYLKDTGRVVEDLKSWRNGVVENIMKLVDKLTKVDPKSFEDVTAKPLANKGYTEIPANKQLDIHHQVQSEYGWYQLSPHTCGNMFKGYIY